MTSPYVINQGGLTRKRTEVWLYILIITVSSTAWRTDLLSIIITMAPEMLLCYLLNLELGVVTDTTSCTCICIFAVISFIIGLFGWYLVPNSAAESVAERRDDSMKISRILMLVPFVTTIIMGVLSVGLFIGTLQLYLGDDYGTSVADAIINVFIISIFVSLAGGIVIFMSIQLHRFHCYFVDVTDYYRYKWYWYNESVYSQCIDKSGDEENRQITRPPRALLQLSCPGEVVMDVESHHSLRRSLPSYDQAVATRLRELDQ